MRPFVVLWLAGAVWLNCAGWVLSALHQLNAGGYAVALVLGAAGCFVLWKKTNASLIRPGHKLRRRFRRGFPLAFLVLTAMAFAGGILYAPSNYDALAYRLPRIFQWLADGRWHWVHTIFDRLNNRSCGIEWVSTPVIVFFHSMRPLFLINFVSYLFLPGLVFSVFRRLGVSTRVAWHWMWLVPTGYCLLLQAGSIGNDMFGVFFALAAVDFALRAAKCGGFAAIATSVMAAGMMTAAKTNDLPLLLPWAVALFPSFKIMLRRPLATLLVTVFAVGGSGLPTFYFNWKMSGDWSGARLSSSSVPHAALYRAGANVMALTAQNLAPPIFPMADQCNEAMKSHLPPQVVSKLAVLGEGPDCWFQIPQMQTEETAGFGFGLVCLLGASFLAALFHRGTRTAPAQFPWASAVRWASVVALAAVLTQASVAAVGRLFAAYYILPCAIILAMPGHERLVRRCWWRGLAWLVFLMAAALLMVSPARPLFPRDALQAKIQRLETAHPVLVRVDTVYSIYRDRPEAFAPVLAQLPPDLKVLGYIAFDKPETSLWFPWKARRIVHVCPGDRPEDLKALGMQYILVDTDEFESWFRQPLAEWLQTMNAEVVREIPLRVRAGTNTQTWSLVRLKQSLVSPSRQPMP